MSVHGLTSLGDVVRLCESGPVLETLTRAEALLADSVDRSVWTLSDAGLIATIDVARSMTARLAYVSAAVVRELDARAVAAAQGASSTANWLRDHVKMTRRGAASTVSFGSLLERRPTLRDTLAGGSVSAEQILVIGQALDALPSDLDPDVMDKAEAFLLDQARQFDPDALRRLADRVLIHVAPEIADEALRRKLEQDEARAHISRTLTITAASGGRSRIFGWLDTESAATVIAAIEPLCKPIPRTADPAGALSGDAGCVDDRTWGRRRADALVEVCRLALASSELPDSGGERPRLTVTVGLDAMTGQLGIGTLDTGQDLPPSAVRRLACDAQIIPAVLDTDGTVIDLGRTRRLYTSAARRALVLRDGGCAFPSCDRPPRWCQGHHIVSWLDGGATDLDNGVLLCGLHHRLIHRSAWQVRLGPDRRPEFVPPSSVDETRTPRRNIFHRRP